MGCGILWVSDLCLFFLALSSFLYMVLASNSVNSVCEFLESTMVAEN